MRNMAYAVTISKIDDIKGKDKIGLLHFKENAYTVMREIDGWYMNTFEDGCVSFEFDN